jgi:hypothetical protein
MVQARPLWLDLDPEAVKEMGSDPETEAIKATGLHPGTPAVKATGSDPGTEAVKARAGDSNPCCRRSHTRAVFGSERGSVARTPHVQIRHRTANELATRVMAMVALGHGFSSAMAYCAAR